MDIRNGDYKLDEVLKLSEQFESQMEDYYINSNVQTYYQEDRINELLIEIYEEFYGYR